MPELQPKLQQTTSIDGAAFSAELQLTNPPANLILLGFNWIFYLLSVTGSILVSPKPPAEEIARYFSPAQSDRALPLQLLRLTCEWIPSALEEYLQAYLQTYICTDSEGVFCFCCQRQPAAVCQCARLRPSLPVAPTSSSSLTRL